MLALALLLVLLFRPEWLIPILAPLTKFGASPIYTQNSLVGLAISHMELILVSIAASGILAVLGGIFVTRKSGADFLPLSRAIANAGQTFPRLRYWRLPSPQPVSALCQH